MTDAATLNGIPKDREDYDIERLYKQSIAEQFGFSPSEFRDLLDDVIAHGLAGAYGDRERSAFLAGLALKDLVLARACARGNEKAWDCFLSQYRERLFVAALAMAKDDTLARELADSLYADLFGTRQQPDGSRVSKLSSYMGRGSLDGWLRTIVAQEYVNWFRKGRKLVSFDETVSAKIHAATNTKYSVAEYEQLAHATHNALTALSKEHQFLLAAYYLDGRTLEEIGRMLSLHQSSVSRRLEKITSGLRKSIIKTLRRAGVSKEAAEEMLELDVRDLSEQFTAQIRPRLAQER